MAKDKVRCLRIVTVVIALIVLGIGCYSHFDSSWKSGPKVKFFGGSPRRNRGRTTFNGQEIPPAHETCEDVQSAKQVPKPCPPIALETIYVLIIIVAFLMSLALLIASCIVNMEAPASLVPKIDFWYHIVAAVLLLLGAILYLASALMINAIYGKEEAEADQDEDTKKGGAKQLFTSNFLFIPKLVAAGLTIVQAVVFFLLGLKCKKIAAEHKRQQRIVEQAQAVGLNVSTTQSG